MDKFRESRKDKLLKPELHDPYVRPRQTGLAHCPSCGAHCQAGRWSWQPAPANGNAPEAEYCPACRRIADNVPAGTLTLSGDFIDTHRDEIINLAINTEKKEKERHPLERLMRFRQTDDGMVITTTGVHLANRIGHALDAAYKGHSEYRYSDSDVHVDIRWLRN